MSIGVICIAQNSNGNDYLRMAYLQALSFNIHNKKRNFSLIVDSETNDCIEQKHIDVFDKIIVLKNDLAKNSKVKMQNECQVFRYSPYKEWIKTEADMLLCNPIYFQQMSAAPFCFTTNVKTYDGHTITDRSQRKLFDDSLLPNIYSAWCYFSYDLVVKEFFDTMRIIIDDWSWYRDNYLVNCRYDEPRTDEVYALAVKILDLQYKNNILTFTHMKPRLQNLQPNRNWSEQLSFEVGGDFKPVIGGFKQSIPFHYVEKTFVTDEILDRYKYEFNRRRSEGMVE